LAAAAEIAAANVAAVRDDPMARRALAEETYDVGFGSRRLPYRRAAMSSTEPRPSDPGAPGGGPSPTGPCEAIARAAGHAGPPSSSTVAAWDEFVARPTAHCWYRAHNGTVVAAYLDHRDLADAEGRAERFFLNVVLLRVLYAHALIAAPRLALGRSHLLGRGLGDPRLGMAGIFLSLSRVLPRRYPLDGAVEAYLAEESGFGRVLDLAVIRPRLQDLYEWSAGELGEPRLARLAVDGAPVYAWPEDERHVWDLPRPTLGARLLAAATAGWR
jgi:hypothetical protein